MAVQNPDVAVVGHFSIDSIRLPSRAKPFVVMGGSVAYVSLVTRRLNVSVSVMSRVGGDFPEAYLWWLRGEGVDVSNVTRAGEEQTTRFELSYNEDLSSRTLRLQRKGTPLTVDALPCGLNAKAIHVAPIAGEIPVELVEHLKKCSDILSLDPQGMSRSFDPEGNVTCNVQADKNVLSLIDVYKSSLQEATVLTGQSEVPSIVKAIHDLGPETVIVTLGAKGAVLSVQGTLYQIPTCISEKVVDPTGAGDGFMGGFLAEYVRGMDALWCACVGSAAASVVVEAIGTTFPSEKEEIYRRASAVYEKEIKP
ncbi:MAG: carbohydrate kinase family protein [Candidatus Bathyarchaeia archaeon]